MKKHHPKYISTNVPGWFRDPSTGATLHLNSDELSLYREKIDKEKVREKHDRELKTLNEKINKLEELINKVLKE